MYTEDDLRIAVESGAISADAADALRNSVRQSREAPAVDEENFRLINSFNDIFVAIGAVIMLFAVGAIGQAIGDLWHSGYRWMDFQQMDQAAIDIARRQNDISGALSVALAGGLVALTSWPLAEFFTRKRRMALPSIILLLAFVGGVFATATGFAMAFSFSGVDERLVAFLIAGAGLIAAAAAWLHWKRFQVPITVAAGAGAATITIIALLVAAIGPDTFDDNGDVVLGLVFLAGLAIFAFAMRWDMSDRKRQTRRADVAFWLHLLAAPMIAHPLFYTIGVTDGREIGAGAAIAVLAVYIAMGLIALTIDRRALLVSALAYVLVTLTWLFDRFGAVELNVALTALVIGSALLTLSAFWSPIRNVIVTRLPGAMQEKLPVTG